MSWSSVALAVAGTVRLKNGGFIQGDVLEHLPGERVSVRMADGTVRNIPWAEVERMEEAAVPAPLPAPTPTPAPPTALTPYEGGTGAPAQPLPEEKSRFSQITLTAFGVIGVLGGISSEADAVLDVGSGSMSMTLSDDSLDLSLGGGVQLDVPVHRYFSIAGLVRLTSWSVERADQRALFVDFLGAPRLRFPFDLSGGSMGVLFVQLPIGASYVEFPPAGSRVSIAFAFGISGGIIALVSEHVGLSFELGWMHRTFATESFSSSGRLQLTTDFVVAQPFLQLGVVFAF